MAAMGMSAQEVPTFFPRKFLLEHFTSANCNQCPMGMKYITEYLDKQTTPYIWVSHHAVYGTDEYTIPASNAIAINYFGMNTVPSVVFNRSKQDGLMVIGAWDVENLVVKDDTLAEASVVIEHQFDAATRRLDVTVSGLVANTDRKEYLLSILIKENGLVGRQEDAYCSWKGAKWQEYMHPRVVRDMVTATFGDTVKVENQAYNYTTSYIVDDEWVAENCCVVAYITPLNKKPVINAEETPLVAGTTGGKEYQPFGITESKEPTNANKLKFEGIELSKPSDDKLEIKLVASSSTRSDMYGPLKMVVTLEFNTTDTVLPIDTLTFAAGNEPGTFSTGTVDLVEQTFGGSRMQYYLAADMETICHTWRIKNGKFLMDNNGGFLATGNLYNGKYFSITCTLPTTDVEDVVFDKTHVEKLMRDGQFVIRIDDVEYDIQGRIISK